MLPPNVLCYGKDEPMPERTLLRAGPLTLFWESGDLRYIRLGDVEVLRRIYVAVRDRNWGTAPARLSDVRMDVGADAFHIRFSVEHRQDEIHFVWRGEITGAADGTIRFSMDGAARSTFLCNRIGFCVLHPAAAAGARACVSHVDGAVEAAVLPVDVVPHQPAPPFAEMAGLSHEAAPGVWAELRFEGGIFEMEDQRNWTDASFKTFCPPLRLPYPVEVRAGAPIRQAITLTLRDERPGPPAVVAPASETPTLIVDAATPVAPLPALGLGMAGHGEPLSPRQSERLRTLRLDHLRADLRLDEAGWEATLRRATSEAQAVGASLHLALFIAGDAAGRELAALRRALDDLRPPVSAFLVYPTREHFGGGAPLAQIVAAARRHLADWPAARLAAGANADYIFLARNLPPLDQVDALTFAIHPQEHAFDNASLVETLRMQATVVVIARKLGRGRPVWVSPVTLKRRFNPHAIAPELPAPPGTLPPAVDARQMSLFGAGWTVGSLKYLAAGGAACVTYYETVGWRGVMETEAGSPAPPFNALAGCVFPLYHVLADVAGFAGGEVVATRAGAPLAVDGLALREGGRLRVLVANLTAESQVVAMRGLPASVWMRSLDVGNVERAMRAPEAFRSEPGIGRETTDGSLSLELPPWAVVRLDGVLI